MTDALYQQAILDHAKAAIGAGRLATPDARATVDNPLCGDRVTVELSVAGGAIAALAHQVRGCLLCEASASILSRRAVGLAPAELTAVATAFERMIRRNEAAPAAWPELQAFEPVRASKGRHECVLLPFQAATRALADLAG